MAPHTPQRREEWVVWVRARAPDDAAEGVARFTIIGHADGWVARLKPGSSLVQEEFDAAAAVESAGDDAYRAPRGAETGPAFLAETREGAMANVRRWLTTRFEIVTQEHADT